MSVRSESLPSESSEEESSSGEVSSSEEETLTASGEERVREAQMWESWEPIVLTRAARFYEGLRRPGAN
jgi:hypothetical protein